MDPVTLVYYGTICGCLALVSPHLSPVLLRLVAGVVVGLIAAAALPSMRQALGL